MDRLLARKLARDDGFRGRMAKLCKDYIRLGEDALNFYAPMYDAAHDMFQGYARLTQKDLDNMDRGHPKNYILPVAATQLITMATTISQMLFGSTRVHRVEGRGPEDEDAAELMNQLLQWNDEQQPTYFLGYNWVLDSLLYNRGVFYESYEALNKMTFDRVMVDDPEDLIDIQVYGPDGVTPLMDQTTGEPVVRTEPAKFARYTKRPMKIGGVNKLYLVGPYEFICDPVYPLYRLQEMRFCGHRKMVSWIELERRSRLAVDDDMYVDPDAVEQLKRASASPGVGVSSSIAGGTTASTSRTAFERTKNSTTPLGTVADDKDGGVVEVFILQIRLIPEDYELDESYEPTIYILEIGNKEHVLSVSMSTFAHDQYPYCIGEPRPSPHYQFAPAWAMQLMPMQTHVDYLKNRHQEALSNTIGNIFIAKLNKVNLTDFLDPNKEGKIIQVLPEAGDTPLRDIIQQVPIQDMTKDFPQEMTQFVDYGNLVGGVTLQMQGKGDSDASATSDQMANDMAKGRMTSTARLLSSAALIPQVSRQVSNFQQFQEEELILRVRGDAMDLPKQLLGAKNVTITRDTIQGTFDFVAKDVTVPGVDARRIAAGTKIIEVGGMFPVIFGGNPGDLDLRKLIYSLAKDAGLPIERFIVPYGAPPPGKGGPPGAPPGAPPDPGAPPPPGGFSGAPTGAPPSLDGGSLTAPSSIDIPSIEPPQVRPQNV
jgi:hypothetical protein